MITVRSMNHVATSRTIPSFRSCRTMSRSPHSLLLDQGRMMQGYAQVLTHDVLRKWRNQQWQGRK